MPTLEPDEVSALMDVIKMVEEDNAAQKGKPAPRPQPLASPYDLTNRDRISRGQMPAIDALNEQIASILGSGLTGRTRLNIKVSPTPATLIKVADVNALMAPPMIVGVLSLGQGHGLALAVLEPGLGDSLLGAAMGDRRARSEQNLEPRRELTTVERLVLKRLLMFLTDAMTRAWAPIIAFKPELLRFESDPRLAAVAPPNESVVMSTFEFTGAMTGRLLVAIPFAAVEPAKKLLAAPPRVSKGGDARFTAALARELEEVKVELYAELGTTHVPVARLLSLEVGELLMLDTDETAAVPICVEGRAKLTGFPRVNHGSHALVLNALLPPTVA